MNQEDFKRLLEKYEKGECTEAEKASLDLFFESFVNPEQWSNTEEENSKALEQELLGKIKQNIQKKEQGIHLRQSHSATKGWLKIAASVVLLLGIGLSAYYYSNFSLDTTTNNIVYITKKTEYGQKLSLTLGDGSKVKLNAGSQLTFPEKFNGKKREVSLKGEAFFEVEHDADRPFIVKTQMLKTKVLGTTFNVSAYAENKHIEVVLATGKVEVTDILNQQVILEPATQARFNIENQQLQTTKVDLEDKLAWKNGILKFEDVPIGEVVKRLERWYGVAIELENPSISGCTLTNQFQNESLENVLESITFIKEGLRYEFKEKNKVLIKGKCSL